MKWVYVADVDESEGVSAGGLFVSSVFFFFNDTATTEIYTLSLHDALPISSQVSSQQMLILIYLSRKDGKLS